MTNKISSLCFLILLFFGIESTVFAGTKVAIETTMGVITVELEDKKAPITVSNFLQYVDSSFYTNTVFHRVINNFMIQGGGFSAETLIKKTTRPAIPLERPSQTGLSNIKGTVSMARTAMPHSATSQFFINVSDNRNLDGYGGGYAVFGKVVDGMAVVNQIKSVPTANKDGMRDVPKNSVIIKQIRRID